MAAGAGTDATTGRKGRVGGDANPAAMTGTRCSAGGVGSTRPSVGVVAGSGPGRPGKGLSSKGMLSSKGTLSSKSKDGKGGGKGSSKRRRWYLGIQSKKEAAHVMTEVYRALMQLGCDWHMLSSYKINCRWRPDAPVIQGNAPVDGGQVRDQGKKQQQQQKQPQAQHKQQQGQEDLLSSPGADVVQERGDVGGRVKVGDAQASCNGYGGCGNVRGGHRDDKEADQCKLEDLEHSQTPYMAPDMTEVTTAADMMAVSTPPTPSSSSPVSASSSAEEEKEEKEEGRQNFFSSTKTRKGGEREMRPEEGHGKEGNQGRDGDSDTGCDRAAKTMQATAGNGLGLGYGMGLGLVHSGDKVGVVEREAVPLAGGDNAAASPDADTGKLGAMVEEDKLGATVEEDKLGAMVEEDKLGAMAEEDKKLVQPNVVMVCLTLYKVQGLIYLLDFQRLEGHPFEFMNLCAKVITQLKTLSAQNKHMMVMNSINASTVASLQGRGRQSGSLEQPQQKQRQTEEANTQQSQENAQQSHSSKVANLNKAPASTAGVSARVISGRGQDSGGDTMDTSS
ncbi:unnamed protein product [Discosporangium mesarthrocarpum]